MAWQTQKAEWADYFSGKTPAPGLPAKYLRDGVELEDLWNFVGAGIFGFLINLPIVSYFEVGTALTNNHAHGSLFGVFGMLALAVLVFCLRLLAEDRGSAPRVV